MRVLLFISLLFVGCKGEVDLPNFDLIVSGEDSSMSLTIIEEIVSLDSAKVVDLLFNIARAQKDPSRAEKSVVIYEKFTGGNFRNDVVKETLGGLNGDYDLDGVPIKLEDGTALMGGDTLSVGLLGREFLVLESEGESMIFKVGESGVFHGTDDGKLLTLRKLTK